jgi:hypothetical protein
LRAADAALEWIATGTVSAAAKLIVPTLLRLRVSFARPPQGRGHFRERAISASIRAHGSGDGVAAVVAAFRRAAPLNLGAWDTAQTSSADAVARQPGLACRFRHLSQLPSAAEGAPCLGASGLTGRDQVADAADDGTEDR